MVDLVYPLGTGSRWENNELRFSLRSVAKHLTGVRNIYVVGELPGWLQGVIHVPFYEEPRSNKERNIYEKVKHLCRLEQVSDQFLFMNDDHFFLQNFDAPTFPFIHKKDLLVAARTLPENSRYRRSLLRTRRTLSDLGLPTVNFDVHCPVLYDKHRFPQVMGQYDWTNTYAFTVKSLYCNSLRIEGVLERDGKVDFVPQDQVQLEDYTKDRRFFSVGDHAITHELAAFMHRLYPQASPWELGTVGTQA